MRSATGLMIAFFMSATLLLCACEDDYTPGEGARRYGWVEDADSSGPTPPTAAIEVAKAGAAPTPAPREDTSAKAPNAPVKEARGGRRGGRGGGSSKGYSELDGGVKNGGIISGTVTLAAGDVAMTPIPIVSAVDQKQCGHEKHPSERLAFDAGTRGLQNVVVMLTDITKGKAWSEDMGKKTKEREAVMDQKECKYVPHIMVARENSQLVVKNSDPAEHNIHGYYLSLQDTRFNFFTAVGAPPSAPGSAKLGSKGLWMVHCDIHAWMNAMIHVVDNPYFAVTDAKGKFEIKDVPPGEYTVKVWHESMKEEAKMTGSKISAYVYGLPWTLSQKVTVKAGETVAVDCVRPLEK